MDGYPNYERAKSYHHNSWQQWYVAKAALQDLTLNGNERILDLGCGSGRLTANLAERVSQGDVVGVDISSGMIEFAVSEFAPLYSNVSFEQRSVLEIPYVNEFDVACSFSALHWCKDVKQALSKAFQALRAAGRLVVTLPTGPSDEVLSVRNRIEEHPSWKPYFDNRDHPRTRHTANECEQFLKSVGFATSTVSVVEHVYMFENKRALIDWFACFSPRVRWIPPREVNRFLVDFADAYTSVIPASRSGEIPYSFSEIHMYATKSPDRDGYAESQHDEAKRHVFA